VRWVTFRAPAGGDDRVGLLETDEVVRAPGLDSLLEALREGPERLRARGAAALATRQEVHRLADVQLRAPLPVPPTIRDFMSFEQHVAAGARRRGLEVAPEWYELPAFYFTNPYAVVGPYDEVPVPPGSSRFDFEVEVAAVIGRPGRDVAPDRAEAYVAGYTILNDWSARDVQFHEMRVGLGPAKGKDTATTLGPALVTPDELEGFGAGRHPDLEMRVQVNGREYGTDRLTNMYWTFGELVAYTSRGTQVRPGDVLGSGTFGYGCLLELSALHGEERFPWLRPGDEVAIEVTGLGRVANRVVEGAKAAPVRPDG
jgi:2-keto-4-pentenoate hydratase/2-oxohepta-3-ene-1,7-dioic acid hydratase in catechol pathway